MPLLRAKTFDAITEAVKGRKNADNYLFEVEELRDNLNPLLVPDAELLDSAVKACSRRRLGQLRHLRKLSETVHKIRTAQAFYASVSVDEDDLSSLPKGMTEASDEALSISLDLRKTVSDGLGLSLPLDLPIETYLEIVEDYQPRITQLLTKVAADGQTNSIEEVYQNIQKINDEILRIKGLRRYAIFEASMGFYRNHKTLLSATLLAGALGLTGGWAGCAGAVAISSGMKLAKRKGWLKDNKAAKRVGQMIAKDVQPYMDRAVAGYLGAELPAINVLSMRSTFHTRQ